MDYKDLREAMVRDQLLPRGIRDPKVLWAMEHIPRHLFVDPAVQSRAYDDSALPTADGQTISQPYMVAVMTELLDLRKNDKVLEIGTGSGYQAAILSILAAEVYTIERFADLAEKAAERFRTFGYPNIFVKAGDGSLGWPEEAPFDRIIITAGAPEIPASLIDQLTPQGVLVAPVGDRHSQQLIRLVKAAGELQRTYHTPCVFVPLVGTFGWQD
ncbi:MAG: protein-L-isoaspartate O-methyltransferase [Thermodesulfovibrio sp.]|nr:protein-L-isoaspartate O-methyltransferase [Thermodesulfovibrio sp.]